MIREKIDHVHATFALTEEDIHLIVCALESYQGDLLALNHETAVASRERAALCEALATALNLAQDVMDAGGDRRPALVPSDGAPATAA